MPCECSNLDWSDVIAEARAKGEATPEHHPNCLVQCQRIAQSFIDHYANEPSFQPLDKTFTGNDSTYVQTLRTQSGFRLCISSLATHVLPYDATPELIQAVYDGYCLDRMKQIQKAIDSCQCLTGCTCLIPDPLPEIKFGNSTAYRSNGYD
jgi:hypothetical protein